MKIILVIFVLVVSLRSSLASITAVCATSDSYWEVYGNKQDNTFTCTGFSAQHTVQWDHWPSPTGVSTSLGECKPRLSGGSQYDCDQPVSPIFLPSRTSDDTSVMVINASDDTNTRSFDNGRLRCTAAYGTTLNGSANCRLDYIIAGTNISCTVQFRKWSVFGQCSTERIYSAQNRYRCQWIQIKESREEILIANTSMTVVPKVSGWCNMTSYLPPVGQYIYRVTLLPGEVTVNASFVGNNTIRLPGSKPSHNCPQYIPEGENVSCTCFVNDLGSPPGELQWNSTRSSQLRFSAVQPGDAGTHTCQLLWNNTVVQSVEYTLTVAYGPRTVTATVVSPQPFDSNGSQGINLNCSVSGSNPPSTITWMRSDNKTILCNTQLCTLTPRPPDDDSLKIECLATNPVTNRTNSDTVTLVLNYPPTSPPVITGNPTLPVDQPVYEGDSFTLTCTVRGGKPSNSTVITFTCPNRTDTPDSSLDSSSVTSSLTIDPVTSYNHGNCSCTASWKSYDWYKQKASWNIDVYTPPSIPVIFPLGDTPGRPVYPFMAGTLGILGCQSNQTGRPKATYSWPVPATGYYSGSNLTLFNLSREDNGRTVNCSASNNYTEHKKPVDDATFVLQVYYEPVISFTRFSDGNDCVEASRMPYYKQCIVAEGQMVHINCTADSNPSPSSFKWLSQNKDVYSNSSELVIPSANHTIHNSDYTCTVVTKQETRDSRLPLTSSAVLTVIVGYSPSVLNFTINKVDNMTVNVQEKSRVDMQCLCNGRPAPSIRLINVTDANFLSQSQPTGNISVDEQRWGVNFSMEQVPCEASGIYKCDVNNSLGQDSQSRTLLVNCAPRGTFGDGNVNITSSTGELIVRMTAYPTPMVEKITFLGLNKSSDGEPVKENTINVECSASSLAPAAVTCNIAVINMVKSKEGFYRIVFNNSFGDLPFTFFVTVSDQTSQVNGQDEKNNVPAIIGGILAAVFVIVLITVIVFLLQRHRRKGNHLKSRSDHHLNVNGKRAADDNVEMIDNDTYAGSEAFEHKQANTSSARGINLGTEQTSTTNKKGKKNNQAKASRSMNSIEVYENVSFVSTEGDHGNSPANLNKQEKIDSAAERNKDGLIYSTLHFDKAKSAKPPPPKHEATEYVSIDLKKTELLQHELNSS